MNFSLSLLNWLKRSVLLLAAMASSAHAGARFKGSTGYQVLEGNTSVLLKADSIENTSKENATGTLMMKLWACDAPYKPGTLNGQLLGSYKLDGLAPGNVYNGLKKTVPYTVPNIKRQYYIVLALVEYQSNGYVLVNYQNMPQPAVLGPSKWVEMDGPYRWQTSKEGGTVEIEVAKIKHHRPGKTGSLKLSVWATKEPYNGGTLNGYQLGVVEKKALEPGYSYTDVKNVAKYTAPPDGSYYVTIVLSEFGNNQTYSISDWFCAGTRSTFGAVRK